jgi:hypothetical protein
MDHNQLLDEKLMVAGRFEVLINQEGWKDLVSYYESSVKALASDLLTSDKPIGDFEAIREQIRGMRKLLGYVDEHLQVLNKFREDEQKNRGITKE